jgi:hypothetical protein
MRLTSCLAALAIYAMAGSAIADTLKVGPLAPADREDAATYYTNGSQLLKGIEYPDEYGNARIFAFGASKDGPSVDDKSYVSLHAYGLLADHGGYLTKWEIKDTNGTGLCGLQLLMPLVNVIDAGDGNALVTVPYWIACDGLDGTVVKLIMVYKDKKYAIRGNLPNQDTDDLYSKPGDNFKELPAAVQKTALAYYAKVEAAAKKAANWTDPHEPQ